MALIGQLIDHHRQAVEQAGVGRGRQRQADVARQDADAHGGTLRLPAVAHPQAAARERHPRQFFNWVSALKAGGVAQLVARQHGGGRRPQVHGQALEELRAGLRQGRWKRAKEIQHWLRQEHRCPLSLKGVYYWLGKLGGVLKVPRKAHAQKNAAQAAAFQQQLCARLRSLNVAGGGRRVRIWVADEHRYGLIPVVRRCWSLRGQRPVAPYQTQYEWAYLYSALEVDGDHAAQFLCLPEVSLEMSRLFLEHLAARDPEAEHVVIWDQAGFHPAADSPELPARIHLIALPPYSPELNPVEALGDAVRPVRC